MPSGVLQVQAAKPGSDSSLAAEASRRPPRAPTKRKLNDRIVNSLKPAPKGAGTSMIVDAFMPGFCVRVSETGRRTFVLVARYPGSKHAKRRALGTYPAMSLEKARAKAKAWLELIDRGVDPQDEKRHRDVETQRRAKNSFRSVAEDYVAEAVFGPDAERPRQRKAKEVKRIIENELIAAWGGRPVVEISPEDVHVMIKSIKARGSFGQARNVLGITKTLFAWAVRQNAPGYGLTASPCTGLKAKDVVGPKIAADRTLTDLEVAAFWRNAGRLGKGPYGAVYRVLLLTGLRLNEVADAAWSEFDLAAKLWSIPKARMKGTNQAARAHAVPLTNDVLEIIKAMPRFKKGGDEFVFSTTAGAKPVWMSSKVKARLDRRMLHSLRALARKRGNDPSAVRLPDWNNHDLRRVVRSGLSRLRVDHDVKEAILAHRKPGLAATYDHYDLLDEKREALERWADFVRSITSPSLDNVLKLPTAGRA